MRHIFIFYAIFSVILLLGLTSMTYPVDAAESESNSDNQSRLECMLDVPSYGELTFVERKLALQECEGVKPDQYVPSTNQIIGVAEDIISFCENFEPVYRLTNEFIFLVAIKSPLTRNCVLLYDTPIWNYDGSDRAKVLLDYLHDQRLQQLEETKEEREKSQIEARLRHGQVMNIVDIFQKQDEKIEFLEQQLEEKKKLIAKNELVIQGQQEMIENLNQTIKTKVHSSTDYSSPFVKKELLECLENADISSLQINEKIKALQDCTKIDTHKLMVIRDNSITRLTQQILEFCQDSYPTYLEFGEHIYHKSQQHPVVEECIWIYQQPIWSYDGPDRTEVLIEAGKPHVEQYLNEKIAERQKSVYNAHLSKARYMVALYFYDLGEREISYLESQISEKDELISQQTKLFRNK